MRLASRAVLAVAAACAFVAVAASARADFGHLVRAGSAVACTSFVDCGGAGTCPGARETCTTLTDSGGTVHMLCSRPLGEELFCCTSDPDCPVVGGLTATCADFSAASAGIPGVCIYHPMGECLVDLTALTSADLARVLKCHTQAVPPCIVPPPPMSTSFVDLAMGDCDRDGIANASDTSPCTPDTTVCMDAGVVDGGASDAGIADAGDGGTNTDLGPEPDAGTDVDLGPAPGMDASTEPPPHGVGFRGAGGCVCGVAPGARGAGLALLALPLALVARRRRQS